MTFSPDLLLGNDYLTPYYADQVLPMEVAKRRTEWTAAAREGEDTARARLGRLSAAYFHAKPDAADGDLDALRALAATVVGALGYKLSSDGSFVTHTYLRDSLGIDVPALAHVTAPDGSPLLVAVAAQAFTADPTVLIDSVDGRLSTAAHKHGEPDSVIDGTDTAVGLAAELFAADQPPRWVLVCSGGAIALIDRRHWPDGKWLGVDIDSALGTNDSSAGGALDQITYLFSRQGTCGEEALVDTAVEGSRKEAVGVSSSLRDAVRAGVEMLANEVVHDMRFRQKRSVFGDDGGPAIDAQDLARQAIRWMYRLVVLLYAEARPQIGILPTDHPVYEAGYGMERLRELSLVPLRTQAARDGRHFQESLTVLFRLVNEGHVAPREMSFTLPDDDVAASSYAGIEFDALRSRLFGAESCPDLDRAHLRDETLQQIIAGLSYTPAQKGKGRQSVSYATLEVNQLGAVYEGLMAYTGFFATEPLYEVAARKSGESKTAEGIARSADPSRGSWTVKVSEADAYPDDVFVTTTDPDTGEVKRVLHERGTFVFRLAGRDRARSASFYTPSVLTEFTVRHALDEWQIANPNASAADVLNMTILEPALGSGAFANEAIDQLANLYLRLRERETGLTVPPEDRPIEIRKLRAHFAVNQTYGVDLNPTAVELAEVSLWLNAMHPGLAAPSLGARLRAGNSLIGARRATYAPAQAAKAPWKGTSANAAVASSYRHPADVPYGTADGIHHFLLPGEGWGAAAKTGKTIVREFDEKWADRVWSWRTAVVKKPTKTQIDRARALAVGVEGVWAAAANDVAAHQSNHDRPIEVWHQPDDTRRTTGWPAIRYADPNGPYQRLKTIMDAWCALWMWAPANTTPPPTLDAWLDMVEYLVGSVDPTVTGTLFSSAQRDDSTDQFGKGTITEALEIWPWLADCSAIAAKQGFFHWDLEYAPVTAAGGLDLQVGNPPWVRPTWDEPSALSEHDPWWGITDLTSTAKRVKNTRRTETLASNRAHSAVVSEGAEILGLNALLGAPSREPLLAGIQVNLYMNFMTGVWPRAAPTGTAALIHPESHFVDPKAGPLRAETYQRLRRHWQFANGDFLFEDVHDQREFGVHVYGSRRPVRFIQAVSVLQPATVDGSQVHDGMGETPGVKFPDGGWDRRPHADRIVTITEDTLADWVRLFDPPGTSPEQSRLLRPLTRRDADTLTAFAVQPVRLADRTRHWTAGFHEKGQKEDGTIRWETTVPASLDRTILQGPHILNATPFAQQSRPVVRHNQDYDVLDLDTLPTTFIPRTNYQLAVSHTDYRSRQRKWDGEPFTAYLRLAHRQMVPNTGVRTFQAALLPPGVAHVHSIASIALASPRETVVTAGLSASLPYDFFMKIGGITNLVQSVSDRLPIPDMPALLESALIHRTLRLNCLTDAYGSHWADMHATDSDPVVQSIPWRALPTAGPTWTPGVPARRDLDRWGLMCDLDAIAALALGITEDQLVQMYRSQFAVLRMYEHQMVFDTEGRQVTRQHHAWTAKQQAFEDALKETNARARRGTQQPKLWERVEAYRDGDTDVDLDYLAPPFTRTDRELAMRTAYRHFAELVGDTSGVPNEPLGDWEIWG